MKLLPTRTGGPVISLLMLIYGPGEYTERASAQSAGGWAYEKTVDKTGRTVHKASVTSANLVPFEYPYQGGSNATLTIRTGNDGPYVSLEVAQGQFNRSFQAGTARVRFDGKPPITYALSAAANGRANIVFFDSGARLINQIKAARNTLVQVRFEGQPVREIQFQTAGLRWNHG